MDQNINDQNRKRSANLSLEDNREPKDKSKRELPPILRPKFEKRRRRRRLRKRTSRDSASRDDMESIETLLTAIPPDEGSENRDEEKPQSCETAEEVPAEQSNHPKEREIEEPACRISDIRIEVPQPPPLMKKSDKKRKMRDSMESLDEGEKLKRNSSRRKKNGRRKKSDVRKAQQGSDERKKHKKQNSKNLSKEQIRSLVASPAANVDKTLENFASKKGKRLSVVKSAESAKKTPTVDSTKKPPPSPKKAINSFFKNIYDKTRSWMRKSDDVAQPTKEMLCKPCVLPEYDVNNAADFLPDPHQIFNEDEWKLRMKNLKCEREDIFINNRPFWINRTKEDVIPKCKLIAHSGLVTEYTLNASNFMKEVPRRSFYDPRRDPMEKFMAVDKVIGVDPSDVGKEKELKRIVSNTFYGTCSVHAYRRSEVGKKKVDDFEMKISTAEEKKLSCEAPKVSFQLADKSLQLNVYNRKERPNTGDSRKFTKIDYSETEHVKKRAPKQKQLAVVVVSPLPAQKHPIENKI